MPNKRDETGLSHVGWLALGIPAVLGWFAFGLAYLLAPHLGVDPTPLRWAGGTVLCWYLLMALIFLGPGFIV